MEREETLDTLSALDDMIQRSERVLPKLKEGSSQLNLVKNRIKALKIAKMACDSELLEDDVITTQLHKVYSPKEIEDAFAPIQSLISKSEKVMLKIKPDSWQYKMTERNINALKCALNQLKP